MARGSTHHSGLTVEGLVRRSWSALPVGLHAAIHIDLLTDLAATLLHQPQEIAAALTRAGRQLGHEGWLLPEVATAVDRVADLADPHADALRGFGACMALGQGWAAGFLHGLDHEHFVDALTGLGTMAVLRMRLEQLYDIGDRAGRDASRTHQLLVLDAAAADRLPLGYEAGLMRLAHEVTASFAAGETAIRVGPRIVVLTPWASRSLGDVAAVATRIADRLGDGGDLMVWVEDLPADRVLLEPLLVELQGHPDVIRRR